MWIGGLVSETFDSHDLFINRTFNELSQDTI